LAAEQAASKAHFGAAEVKQRVSAAAGDKILVAGEVGKAK
jgi:hypothetical protein